jgi:hypothetical protein
MFVMGTCYEFSLLLRLHSEKQQIFSCRVYQNVTLNIFCSFLIQRVHNGVLIHVDATYPKRMWESNCSIICTRKIRVSKLQISRILSHVLSDESISVKCNVCMYQFHWIPAIFIWYPKIRMIVIYDQKYISPRIKYT